MSNYPIKYSTPKLSYPFQDTECFHFETDNGTVISFIINGKTCFELFGMLPNTIGTALRIFDKFLDHIRSEDANISIDKGVYVDGETFFLNPTSIKQHEGYSIRIITPQAKMYLCVAYPKGMKLGDALISTGYLFPAALHMVFLVKNKLVNKGVRDAYMLHMVIMMHTRSVDTGELYINPEEDLFTNIDQLEPILPIMVQTCLELEPSFDETKTLTSIIIGSVIDYQKLPTGLYAQLVLKLGEYLNSKEFLYGEMGRAYYNYSDNNAVSSGLNIIAFANLILDHYSGSNVIGNYHLRFTDDGDVQKSIYSLSQAWMQLLEFSLHGVTEECLRFFAPNHTLYINMMGLDIEHDQVPNLDEINFQIIELITEAEKEGVYDPYCSFTVAVPDEFKAFLKSLLPKIADYSLSKFVEVDYLKVFTEGDGMWVRLCGPAGEGAIIRWEPTSAYRPNLMSVTTANLLDLLLSSLWRDLRVEGPVSISPVTGKRRGSSKKVTPLTDQEKQDLKKQHRFIPRKSEYRLTMSGRVEWGTEDEKSHIKRHLHTVSGHARTLPAGYKPDPEKVRLAEMRKIKLDPRQTFVRRHQRGTGSDPNQVEVVVHSKGLSELYMVLQGQEK